METFISRVIVTFESQNMQCHIAKLLNNLVCSSPAGEYWSSFIYLQNSLLSVRTTTTLGQYSQVRHPCSFSKRLLDRYAFHSE